MIDPRKIAFDTVAEMIEEGLKKHGAESWKHEPAPMHLMKASRHAQSALLKLNHPEFVKDDRETQIDHAKRAVCRAVMALTILLNRSNYSAD